MGDGNGSRQYSSCHHLRSFGVLHGALWIPDKHPRSQGWRVHLGRLHQVWGRVAVHPSPCCGSNLTVLCSTYHLISYACWLLLLWMVGWKYFQFVCPVYFLTGFPD